MSKNNYPLGRPPKAGRGVPADHRPGERTCLGLNCGKVFMSLGPGNRKCRKCAMRQVYGGSPRRGGEGPRAV